MVSVPLAYFESTVSATVDKMIRKPTKGMLGTKLRAPPPILTVKEVINDAFSTERGFPETDETVGIEREADDRPLSHPAERAYGPHSPTQAVTRSFPARCRRASPSRRPWALPALLRGGLSRLIASRHFWRGAAKARGPPAPARRRAGSQLKLGRALLLGQMLQPCSLSA